MAQIVNIIGSTISDTLKSISARIGIFFGGTDDEVTSEQNELIQSYGFASRPKPADEDGCAEGLQITLGGKSFVINTRDPRYHKILGQLSEGDSAIFAAVDKDAAAIVKCQADGMVYISAPVEIDGDGAVEKSHNVVLDPNSDSIIIAHSAGKLGPSVTLQKDGMTLAMGSQTLIQITDGQVDIMAGKINLYGMVSAQGVLGVQGIPLTVP